MHTESPINSAMVPLAAADKSINRRVGIAFAAVVKNPAHPISGIPGRVRRPK